MENSQRSADGGNPEYKDEQTWRSLHMVINKEGRNRDKQVS
ncbi:MULTISPECIES: hypothetical protein [unclassified Moorena]|nr:MULTISPECIES: hypothetical protein [unclassified Moorena]